MERDYIEMHAVASDYPDEHCEVIEFYGARDGSSGSSTHLKANIRLNNNIAVNFNRGQSRYKVPLTTVTGNPVRQVEADALDWLSDNAPIPGTWSMVMRRYLPLSPNQPTTFVFSFSDKKFATIFRMFFG